MNANVDVNSVNDFGTADTHFTKSAAAPLWRQQLDGTVKALTDWSGLKCHVNHASEGVAHVELVTPTGRTVANLTLQRSDECWGICDLSDAFPYARGFLASI